MSTAKALPADFYWKQTDALSESKAIGHAWTEFRREDDGSVVITVNRVEALRLSIKYRETGPFLCVEILKGGSCETMGACLVAAEMAQRYAGILEAHNELGERLHSARTFLISPEEKERARAAHTAGDTDG